MPARYVGRRLKAEIAGPFVIRFHRPLLLKMLAVLLWTSPMLQPDLAIKLLDTIRSGI
jgi:hypothetical protein